MRKNTLITLVTFISFCLGLMASKYFFDEFNSNSLIKPKMKVFLPKFDSQNSKQNNLGSINEVSVAQVPIIKRTILKSQIETIKLIEDLGGNVVYDFEKDFDGANIPVNHPKLDKINIVDNTSTLAQIIFVHINNESINDDFLQLLNKFPNIRGLSISSKKITDKGLKHLVKLKYLERLWLVGTGINGTELHKLKALKNLKDLNLGGAPITDEGLNKLSSVNKLEYLIINGDKITDKGMAYLPKLSHLKQLSIDRTKITGDGLKYLMDFPALDGLSINKDQLSGNGLSYIEKALRLRTLWVQDIMITKAQETELKKIRPDLKINIWCVRG